MNSAQPTTNSSQLPAPASVSELQKYLSAPVVFVGWNTVHAEVLKKKVLEYVVQAAISGKRLVRR